MIKKSSKKGFTLIELLLVVAIVTLLSSIFFYSSSEARKKTEDAHMAEESRQVSTAVQIYYDNKGVVPYSTNVQAEKLYNEKDENYTRSLAPLVSAGYISEIPTSPSGESYFYGFTDGGKKAYFYAKTNKNEDVCETVGEENGENSCEGLLNSNQNLYFILNIGNYTTISLPTDIKGYFSVSENSCGEISLNFDIDEELNFNTENSNWSCSKNKFGNINCDCNDYSMNINYLELNLIGIDVQMRTMSGS